MFSEGSQLAAKGTPSVVEAVPRHQVLDVLLALALLEELAHKVLAVVEVDHARRRAPVVRRRLRDLLVLGQDAAAAVRDPLVISIFSADVVNQNLAVRLITSLVHDRIFAFDQPEKPSTRCCSASTALLVY